MSYGFIGVNSGCYWNYIKRLHRPICQYVDGSRIDPGPPRLRLPWIIGWGTAWLNIRGVKLTTGAEVKNEWSYTPCPPTYIHGVLRKHLSFPSNMTTMSLTFTVMIDSGCVWWQRVCILLEFTLYIWGLYWAYMEKFFCCPHCTAVVMFALTKKLYCNQRWNEICLVVLFCSHTWIHPRD